MLQEVINTLIVVMMSNGEHAYQFQKVVLALVAAVNDSKPKVRDAATDALSVIAETIGSEAACGLLSFANIDDEMFFELQDRFGRHELPKISAEGIVLHVAHGGGRGLTIDSGESFEDGGSRRQTPAMGTPSKIPWDLPSSARSGPRLSSGAGRRGGSGDSLQSLAPPSSQCGRRASVTDGAAGEQPGEPAAAVTDWGWPADGSSGADVYTSAPKEDRPPNSRGVLTAGKPYFENSDYKALPAVDQLGSADSAWWDRGDHQGFGDLVDPISPHRANGCGPPQHGLSSKKMALITSDCGATRSLSIK